MWRFTVNTVAYMRFPFDNVLRSVSKAGFKRVEIGEAHINMFKLTRAGIKEIREQFDSNGLEISSVMAEYGFDPTAVEGHNKFSFGHSSPLERERKVAVAQEKKAIETAAELGCSHMLTEFTGDIDNPEKSKISFMKSIGEIIPALEEHGTTLCIEPHPGDFVEDAFPAIDMLRSFDCKLLKFNYCVPHTFVLGHSPKEIIGHAKGILGHSHVADSIDPLRIYFCPSYIPKIKPHLHLIPGLGDVNFHEYVQAMVRANYDGYLSLDVFSHADKPTEAMVETRQRIQKITKGLLKEER